MNRKQYIKLQNEWYARLKRDGFNDIEWYDPETGKGQNADWLKQPASRIATKYNDFTATHYRICQNFTTNCKFFRKKDRKIFELYCDGVVFRDILKHLRDLGGGYAYDHRRKKNISLYSLHKIIKKYIRFAYIWNRNSPEGLLFEQHLEVSGIELTDYITEIE